MNRRILLGALAGTIAQLPAGAAPQSSRGPIISLISRWKLNNGCPPDLLAALARVADQVREAEPDTLLYMAHLPGPVPVDSNREPQDPAAPPIALDQQTEVVFVEIYKDAAAFAHHLNGPTFTAFRTANISYFDEDPANPGWPNAETQFLERQSAFIRPGAG